jgi:hypothetical protein
LAPVEPINSFSACESGTAAPDRSAESRTEGGHQNGLLLD